MSIFLIYAVAKNHDEAKKIGHALVTQKLVACVNIFPALTSIFEWEDRIHEVSEVALIAKTSDARLDEAMATIKAHHSYECPCIVAWPLEYGQTAFLNWVAEKTENNPS